MSKYRGGDEVGKGTYWDLRNGTRVDLDDKGTLPGGPGLSFRKMPPAVMLVAAPFAGLFYVIALPFVAIVTVLVLLAKRLLSAMLKLVVSLAGFTWRPAHAHLTGKKKDERESAKQEQDDTKPPLDSVPPG